MAILSLVLPISIMLMKKGVSDIVRVVDL